MSNYSGFAYMYDLLMGDIPYKTWAAYIDSVLTRHLGGNRTDKIVLDMACGTGNITCLLADIGYDMIGVDISTDMLSQAQAKADGRRILFLAQDIRELDLYGTIDAAVCTCDGLNYILEAGQLAEVFGRVKMFLNPGGVFIFDMNTEFKFKEVLSDKSFVAKVKDAAYEWDNHFDAVTGVNRYHVIFMPEGGTPFEEVHHQRAFPVGVVCDLLQKAGFDSVVVYDGYSDELVKDDSMRAVFVCQKPQILDRF